jgi:hypothetical protein
MGPGSHGEFLISAENKNPLFDHPMNISARLSLTLDPMGISHFHLFF